MLAMRSVRSLHGRRFCSVSAMLFFLLFDVFFVAEFFPSEVVDSSEAGIERLAFSKVTCPGIARKLLHSPDEGDTNRIGTTCSKYDIVVIQGPTTPLPNGIPTYTVQIMNVNVSGCGISNIHVSCGWFSSARLVNPRVFRRVYYDDCLVNDGDALGPGESLSFEYSNSFSYPLSVSSVECC